MSPDNSDAVDDDGHPADAAGPALPDPANLPALVATVTSLGCGTIVIVDDDVPDIEAIRADLIRRETPPKSLEVEIKRRGGWPIRSEERRDLLESIVDAMPFVSRREVTSALYAEAGKGAVDWESSLAEPLIELKAAVAGLEIVSVSPRDWEKHAPTFTDQADPSRDLPIKGTPFLLFDYDLSKVPGRRDDQGLALAKKLIAATKNHAAYCGVISQKFDNPQAAMRVRSTLIAADRDRLVLLSKNDLQNYATLANLLKLVYRAHSAAMLRELTREAIAIAHGNAMKELEDLEVAPLLHVVVDRSYVEGMSEFDTVKRLYLLKLSSALSRSEVETALQPLVESLQTMKLARSSIPRAVIDLEHEERYRDIAMVNRRHLPIDLGDVFRIGPPGGGKKRKYVLVTQACDLMVRSEGGRQVTHGVMLGVSESKPQIASLGYPLRFAKNRAADGTRGDLYVRFRPPVYMPLFVLDLCVFSGSGQAMMRSDAEKPAAVPHSMKMLQETLRERVAAIVGNAKPMPSPAASDDLVAARESKPADETPLSRQLLVPPGSFEGVAGRTTGESVVYDCERMMRLAPNIASDLLAEYSHFTGRTAADMGMAGPE
jgi:hypothetical protein